MNAIRLCRWLSVAVVLIGLCLFGDWWIALPQNVQPTYVGGQRCVECHLAETKAWRGSHHDLAMQIATDDSVLGDFQHASLDHFGVTSTMYRDNGRFMIRTQGPSGALETFEIKYAFGVQPLQQYLVETEPPSEASPESIGRLQVLPICWDTQRKQWFYLSPPDVQEAMQPDDPLFWTNYGQNWNHMCAVCHSTNLRKNFDLQQNAFATTYSDINVHCETCHGPGSLHVQLAEAKSLFWDRRLGRAIVNFKSASAAIQISACAGCHSRRQVVAADDEPTGDYYDHYINSLIEPGLYYPDGQIRDEVYVYGSFLQSKMYAEGIRCTDCHQPHALTLKHQGNAVCTSCHQHSAAKYDTVAHHHHAAGSAGAMCVECHMPATVYMDVDWRRDHSMSIPRPDLSLELNTPNACTGCHLKDQPLMDPAGSKRNYAQWIQLADNGDSTAENLLRTTDRWAVEKLADWSTGSTAVPENDTKRLRGDLARALHRAWNNDSTVAEQLLQLATTRKLTPIQRASALRALSPLEFDRGIVIPKIKPLLQDQDPQVRIVAIESMSQMADSDYVEWIAPLLKDERRAVRITAARILVATPEGVIPRPYRPAMQTALAEYRQGLQANGDQAGAHMGLAAIAEQQGDWPAAERAYRRAIQVQPGITGPRSNLAQLVERRGDTAEALKLRREEILNLSRDARLVPDNVEILTRFGFGLYLVGDKSKAIDILERVYEIDPAHQQSTYFLALLYQQQNQLDKALTLVDRLIKLAPQNAAYQQLREQIVASMSAEPLSSAVPIERSPLRQLGVAHSTGYPRPARSPTHTRRQSWCGFACS